MPMLSFIDVLSAQLLNAINHMDPNSPINANARIQIAMQNFSCIDMYPLSIAQVTMFSWLPCLQEQLLWTLLSFLLQEINHVLNLKQVSI
jgi:hypothetical protein